MVKLLGLVVNEYIFKTILKRYSYTDGKFFVELFKLLAKIDLNPLVECATIDIKIGFESVILKEKTKDTEEIIPGVYLYLILSNERKMNYINKFFEKYNISYDQLSLDVEYKE